MCGIFAAFSLNKPIDISEKQSNSIIDKLFLRGPNNQSFVKVDSHCVLAHTRLSILDLNHSADQPMSNSDGSICIVFNGEIYNYKELRKLTPDYKYKTNGDTEVIIALYETFGSKFVSKLRGMFSIVIYDKKFKKLISIVDRFGIKPLYYFMDENTLYVSSRIDVINIFNNKYTFNNETISKYFFLGELYGGENTFFNDVLQLQAATILTLNNHKLSKECYWDKSFLNEELQYQSYADYVDYVDDVLIESIKMHQVSDVEVAVNLSSGLDSNFFRMAMSESLSESELLKCFSFCFCKDKYNECIDFDNLDSNKFQINKTHVNSSDILDALERTIFATEGPVGGMGMIGFWMNMRDAKKHGIKVMMSGQGADELFAGYQYYINLSANQNKKNLVLASDGTSLGNADYVKNEYFDSTLNVSQEKYFDSSLKNSRYLDLSRKKIPKLLMWQDKLSMDHSIETRVPFLDHIVFESLFHIPEKYLIQGKTTKAILRDVAKRYAKTDFDLSLCNTSKKYMPTPQREWFKSDFYEYTMNLIDESLLHDLGMIDKLKLKKSYQNYVNDINSDNSYFIWKFINMELLFRMHS
jgi:asparagine synthase (glutamine-hydrolysing)